MVDEQDRSIDLGDDTHGSCAAHTVTEKRDAHMIGRPIRVLLIEDDEDDYILIRDLLLEIPTSEYVLDWISYYDTALEALCRNRYDICLLDYKLGDRSGLDLLKDAKGKECGTPVILLSGYGSYEVDVEGMRAGATDYLSKHQISASLLERSIRYAVEQSRQQATRRREALLQKVLDELPIGVWITDRKGCIIRCNAAGKYISGDSRPVGMEGCRQYKGWWLDTGQNIEPGEWAGVRAIQRGETSLNEEIEIETFDGKRKIILNSAIPIRDEGGEISGAIIINQDITSRKHAEQHIRYLTRQLIKRQESERQKLSYNLHDVIGQEVGISSRRSRMRI